MSYNSKMLVNNHFGLQVNLKIDNPITNITQYFVLKNQEPVDMGFCWIQELSSSESASALFPSRIVFFFISSGIKL